MERKSALKAIQRNNWRQFSKKEIFSTKHTNKYLAAELENYFEGELKNFKQIDRTNFSSKLLLLYHKFHQHMNSPQRYIKYQLKLAQTISIYILNLMFILPTLLSLQTNFFSSPNIILPAFPTIINFLDVLYPIRVLQNILQITSCQSSIINHKQQMALPFALLIPGQPLLTGFQCTNGIYHIDIQEPRSIANISIFLTEPIPQNYAISLYFSLPPYNQMQYLGAVANARPSDTFSTGFPFKTEFQRINTVKLCIQAQSFEQVVNLVKYSDGQKEYSKLVAHNLYNFMMSFHNQKILTNNYYQGREYLVVPTDTFTRWMKKFDEKYQKDPNFILKTTIE